MRCGSFDFQFRVTSSVTWMAIVDRWKKMRDNRVAAVDDTSEQNVQRSGWDNGFSNVAKEIVIEISIRYESNFFILKICLLI